MAPPFSRFLYDIADMACRPEMPISDVAWEVTGASGIWNIQGDVVAVCHRALLMSSLNASYVSPDSQKQQTTRARCASTIFPAKKVSMYVPASPRIQVLTWKHFQMSLLHVSQKICLI